MHRVCIASLPSPIAFYAGGRKKKVCNEKEWLARVAILSRVITSKKRCCGDYGGDYGGFGDCGGERAGREGVRIPPRFTARAYDSDYTPKSFLSPPLKKKERTLVTLSSLTEKCARADDDDDDSLAECVLRPFNDLSAREIAGRARPNATKTRAVAICGRDDDDEDRKRRIFGLEIPLPE